MINIDTQIQHWLEGSREKWDVACELIANKRIRHGLFWAHLAPRIHNLARLIDLAGLEIDLQTKDFLFEINKFNLVGRYSEHQGPVPNSASAKVIMSRVEEILQCLIRTL